MIWTTLINLQTSFYRWNLHLSLSKLQLRGGTITYLCLFVTLGWTTLISPNFNLGWSKAYFCLSKCPIMKSTLINLQTSSINGMKWWKKSTRRRQRKQTKQERKTTLPLEQPSSSKIEWKSYLKFVLLPTIGPLKILSGCEKISPPSNFDALAKHIRLDPIWILPKFCPQ